MMEKNGRYIIGFKDIPSERQQIPELEVGKRTDNFKEVELGFTIEQAQQDAIRCLSCRRCLGCGLCLAVCEPKAIVFEQEDELIDLAVDAIVISKGVERSAPRFDPIFGYGQYKNVVSSFEFERILSDDGPYGGLILRPFDGDIPKRLGFIVHTNQNHGGQKEDNYALLSYTFEEALLALKNVEDLEISVFIPEETDAGELILKAESQGLTIKTGKIAEIQETEETKNLMVKFEIDGKQEEKEYDMLVISSTPEIPAETKALYKKMGLSAEDQYPSLWESSKPSLRETSIPNVFLT